MNQIQRGLKIPIAGGPAQDIENGPPITKVGLVGDDYVGLVPKMLVQVGDQVKLGQPVFEDKKNAGVFYVAPASGRVVEINRGAKRKFEALGIEIDGDAEVEFTAHRDLQALSRDQVAAQLQQSGLWTALRTRPFNKVPSVTGEPHSIFVTAIDTNPLASDPELIIEQHKDDFVSGLAVISKLTRGKTFVCTRDHSRIPGKDVPGVFFEVFAGPHPAGLPGTHIHFLDPVGPAKTVWFINYQDVIAVGRLFTTGRLMVERTIAVAGPRVRNPILLRTRLGAHVGELVAGRVQGTNNRIVSGSVLSGRKFSAPHDYLGRYHLQVSVLEEGNHREFLGWQKPGADKFSVTKAYLGSWLSRQFNLTTSTGGSHRAMVPIGVYERVMPLDILPTQLLRALLTKDTDSAQALGCLELDEDDVALCTFVCPGKYDYGSALRENLSIIEKDG
ncbi:MAG: Na(+)-translocating NADH-quinone reductase subunit A [Pirellulaceae bacterium]|nr:Na(+)-translocating NADH-quinone reductase subunit A [Pirellulaceae bacterium]